ncbi:PHP domain-containing protein [Roseburia hominis]
MFVDMHMHELTYSTDSFLKLEEMVEIAKKKGLGGICITDHDSMGLRDYAAEYSKKTGFPIFTGIEFYSLQGDILAFGIDDYPRERIGAQDFIDQVRAQGGITISAHPFRNNRRGLEEHLDIVQGLDGIEVLNGSTLPDATAKAEEYAKKLGLAATGASDCHVPDKVGVYATYFPNEIRTMDELIKAVRNHECQPAYYKDGIYHIYKF